MKRNKIGVFILVILSCKVLANSEIHVEKWIGTYEGVSNACINEPFIITRTTLSHVEPTNYSECLNSKIEVFEESENFLAVKVLRQDCRMSNYIFTFTDQGRILVENFKSEEGYKKRDKNDRFFYCVYHKRLPKK